MQFSINEWDGFILTLTDTIREEAQGLANMLAEIAKSNSHLFPNTDFDKLANADFMLVKTDRPLFAELQLHIPYACSDFVAFIASGMQWFTPNLSIKPATAETLARKENFLAV